jgi:hypothetical protein
MRRFEHEPRALKPDGFDAWLAELGDVADALGAWALIGAWRTAPTDYCRYLVSMPGRWDELISRGRHADELRWAYGVHAGRLRQRLGNMYD